MGTCQLSQLALQVFDGSLLGLHLLLLSLHELHKHFFHLQFLLNRWLHRNLCLAFKSWWCLGLSLSFFPPAWFLPIQNLDRSSILDYKCWSLDCLDSCCNCLVVSIYKGHATMNDHFHKNHRTKVVLPRHWPESCSLDFAFACTMLPSMLIRH